VDTPRLHYNRVLGFPSSSIGSLLYIIYVRGTRQVGGASVVVGVRT